MEPETHYGPPSIAATATVARQDVPGVHAATAYIEDRLDRLVDVVSNLDGRLTCVLNPNIPPSEAKLMGTGAVPRSERSGVADRLQMLGDRIDGLGDTINTILARLEV